LIGYTERECDVLTALQRGVEPVARPFQTMALPEAAVVDLLRRALSEGLVRRFGGIFDARRLGYRSVLCALDVAPDRLDTAAAVVCASDGVTHCYERRPVGEMDGAAYPGLWFTMAQLQDDFDRSLAQVRSVLGDHISPVCLIELPAVRRFKIDVVFDLRTRDRDELFPGAVAVSVAADKTEDAIVFTEQDRALVRCLDQQIPVVDRPFLAVAGQVGMSEDAVLATLARWRDAGVLRRVAAVLHHREAGFKANAMCVWPVQGDVIAAGRQLADCREVTHCYQRPRFDGFAFDLYAMIHTPSWPQTQTLFDAIASECGLCGGRMFASVREFKKSSMRYFA